MLVVQKKSSTFAPANQLSWDDYSNRLGYGVMVTLQILVLSFLVRVRVPQPNEVAKQQKFCA